MIVELILFSQIKSQKRKGVCNCPEMDYFMKDSVSDVVFVVEGQRLPAIRFLLSIKSKVFRAMFSGHFKESEDKEVVIEDTTYEAFKTFIQFLYCDQLVLKDHYDLKLIEEVCQLSDRYDVNRILEKVDHHLMTAMGYFFRISDSRFNWITKIAFDYNLPNMKTKVLSYIDQNFKHFISFAVNKNLKELDVITHNHLVDVLVQNYHKLNRELVEANEQLNRTKQTLDAYEKRKCKHCHTISSPFFGYNLKIFGTCKVCDKL